MSKKSKSETKWLSPETKDKNVTTYDPESRKYVASTLDREGSHYVLQHTTEEPTVIRLCVGGSNTSLDVAMMRALVADLQDAIATLEPAPAQTLHPHGGFLDRGAYDK